MAGTWSRFKMFTSFSHLTNDKRFIRPPCFLSHDNCFLAKGQYITLIHYDDHNSMSIVIRQSGCCRKISWESDSVMRKFVHRMCIYNFLLHNLPEIHVFISWLFVIKGYTYICYSNTLWFSWLFWINGLSVGQIQTFMCFKSLLGVLFQQVCFLISIILVIKRMVIIIGFLNPFLSYKKCAEFMKESCGKVKATEWGSDWPFEYSDSLPYFSVFTSLFTWQSRRFINFCWATVGCLTILTED